MAKVKLTAMAGEEECSAILDDDVTWIEVDAAFANYLDDSRPSLREYFHNAHLYKPYESNWTIKKWIDMAISLGIKGCIYRGSLVTEHGKIIGNFSIEQLND